MTLEQEKALEAAIKAVGEHYGYDPVWRLYGGGFAKTEWSRFSAGSATWRDGLEKRRTGRCLKR